MDRKLQNNEKKRVKRLKKALTKILWPNSKATTNSGLDRIAQLIVVSKDVSHKMLWCLALLFLLGCSSSTFGQGARFDSVAQKNVQGFLAPIPGATITVCTAAATGTPCAPLVPTSPVTLCTDATCSTAAPNPFLADSNGNYGFWAVPGTYKVSITGAGVTGQLSTVTLPLVNPTAALTACVTNGFYSSALVPTCYATVQAAITAACALSPVGTVTIPPGTYTGPTTFCSNLRLMGLSSGESRAAVGNLGVTPLTAATAVSLTYSSTLNLTALQNMDWENLQLDFGSCTGCSFTLTSSSFNQFRYVTLNNVGDTAAGQAALLITVTNGTSAALGSVWNSFDHLRINCNGAASHYCYAAVELLGAGTVNAAPAAFATLNRFWDLGVTGQYRFCIDAELNSDTNYFWSVNCNENANPVPTNSAVLAFNLNTPASDQDADGGVYEGVVVAGLGPSTFIRAGQSNGNRISISQGSAGTPTLAVTGGTPLYTVHNIGLPGVNANIYVGGAVEALGSMATASPGIAGDVTAARNSTTGVYYFGTDGGNLNRVGAQLLTDGAHIAGLGLTEQGANPCSTGVDLIFGNAGTHQLDLCNNSTTFFPVSQTIGTGNVTTAGTAINTLTCQAQTAITVTGAVTTDNVMANIGAALPATWQTGIAMQAHVTATNTVTVYLCNPTATATITPAATQVNVRVVR